jgi:hypothetical protein
LPCALSLIWVAGCAGSPTAASSPPPAASAGVAPGPASDAPMPSGTAAVVPTPPANSADSTPAPAPAPALIPICDAKCDKLVAKCGKVSVENCRLNCGKYDPPPTGCVEQVRAALECARDAKDLTCANVAPESCSAKFREIAACSSGATAQKSGDAPAGLPEGWERVTDSANGFSVALPRGLADKKSGDHSVRAVTVADTTYTVSVLPVPTEKPSEKTLLRVMMKIQGRCSDKLKLDGFVEKAGRSSIHFMSHCPDKTDWDGMLYIGAQNMVMLSAQAPAGKIGQTEPFFYEFEYSAP